MRATHNRLFPLITVLLASFLCLFLLGWGFSKGPVSKASTAPTSILVCGVDDAGNHTDVMALFSVTPEAEAMSILQIPRDTLVIPQEHESPVKLNSRFAAYLAEGHKKEQAAVLLKQEVSALLGVRIDHVFVTDTDTVASFVDALGGVSMTVPHDYTYTDPKGQTISVKAGVRRLNGQAAVGFLRNRTGYALGDLDRMDAQKLFFSALFKEMTAQSITLPLALRAGRALAQGHVWTDLSLWDAAKDMYSRVAGISPENTVMTTLAGEALYTDHTWYYVVRRAAADAQLSRALGEFYGGLAALDPENRLTDKNNMAVNNAYTDSDRTYQLYTVDRGPSLE